MQRLLKRDFIFEEQHVLYVYDVLDLYIDSVNDEDKCVQKFIVIMTCIFISRASVEIQMWVSGFVCVHVCAMSTPLIRHIEHQLP